MKGENEFVKILSLRLGAERIKKGLTLDELADKTGITRQIINYVEVGDENRTLKLKDIIKIADILEVSIDYLVGRIDSKTDTAYKTDIKEWCNNTLGSFDKFMDEIKDKNLSYYFNAYIFVAYVNNNVIKETLDKIKNKIEQQSNLNKAEVQKLEFLSKYVTYIREQKTKSYDYLRYLVNEEWKDDYIGIEEECKKMVEYSENSNIEINFDIILKFQEMLGEFEEYLSYEVNKQLNTSKIDLIDKIVKDKRYFYKIEQYFEEVNH